MKKFTMFAILLLCVGSYSIMRNDIQTPTAQAQSQAAAQFDPRTPTFTASASATPNVTITLLFLGATDTAVAVAKTEAEQHAQRETQAIRDLEQAAEFTRQTQAAAVVQTQLYWNSQTQIQSTIVAGSSTASAAGTMTQGAAAGATATQVEKIAVGSTHLAATQEIERNTLVAKKASIWGLMLMVLIVGGLGLARLGVWVWKSWKVAQAEYLQLSRVEPDTAGRFPLVPVDSLGKTGSFLNANLGHRALVGMSGDDLTVEQALMNKQMNNQLEMTRAIAASPALMRKALSPRSVTTETGLPEAHVGISRPALPLLTLPDWHLLNQWDGQLLPYGADGHQRLLTVDPAKRPHLMITGTTGTGKTRYEIRTIVAGALTSGWQVIVIGKQADYIPFEEHPNVTLIPANAVKEPEKYIRILKAAAEQMFARDEFLVSRKLSTWDRYGAPQTLIVVDDYSAAMMMMPTAKSREVLTWALAIAMDGRKYGLNLLLGLQRATWTCISTDLRSQMARITMRVESARESRIVLDEDGAEALPERHFLARLEEGSGLIRGAAFAMSDAETFTFLASRPAEEIGPANWIDAQSTDVEPAPKRDIDEEIRMALTYMKERGAVSLSQVQRDVFGDVNTGGSNFRRIQKIWMEMEAKPATTTDELPDSGTVASSATGSAA